MTKNKKLTKTEVKKISQKLGWSLKDTQKAITEFRNSKSFVNQDDFLQLCLNSENHDERIEKTVDYLVKFSDIDIISNIDAILNYDPFLYVLWTFKIFELNNLDYIDVDFLIAEENRYKRGFLLEHPDSVRISTSQLEDMHRDSVIEESDYLNIKCPGIDNIMDTIINQYIIRKIDDLAAKKTNIKLDDIVHKLDNMYKSKFSTFYKNKLHIAKLDIKKLDEFGINKDNIEEEIYLALIRKYKFEIFKIESIGSYILYLSASEFLPYESKILKKIRNILSNRDEFIGININRNEITEKRYWFYYCLIEKIKEKTKSNKTQPACKIVARLFNENFTSIRTRHYEKNEKRKEDKNFELDNFIKEQGFSNHIKEYLEKAESIK